MSRRKRQRRPRTPNDPLGSERAELLELELELTVPDGADKEAIKPLLSSFITAVKAGDEDGMQAAGEELATHEVVISEADGEPDVDDTPGLDFTPAPGVPQPDGPGQGGVQPPAEEVGGEGDGAAEPGETREYDPRSEDPPEWEEGREEEPDFEPLRPPVEADLDEPPVFPLGPLAAGIQMFEAMLEQAKAGYISERVDHLESALREEFGPRDRMLLADYASRFRDGMGLPDVSGAYEQLVARRGEEVRAAEELEGG